VVGDLAAVLAELKVPAVEEGGVGQGPRDADRDVAFSVVGEDGGRGEGGVAGGVVDVYGEEVRFGEGSREKEGARVAVRA
jgi:hypothetical protein